MRKSSLAVLGAVFLAGATALPAKADVHQIGSVNVAADHFTGISWEHFEGAVERLQFVAQGDTIDCAHISVTYRDGTTHKVFEGVMPKDSIETIDLPRRRQSHEACRFRLQGPDCGWRPHGPVGHIGRLGPPIPVGARAARDDL